MWSLPAREEIAQRESPWNVVKYVYVCRIFFQFPVSYSETQNQIKFQQNTTSQVVAISI